MTETVALVLHYRDAALTLACLRSLLDNAVRRVVIVDNTADRGKSLHAVADNLDSLRNAGLQIRTVAAFENLGFSRGVNLGLRAIRDGFGAAPVLLMNNDARLGSGAHAALRKAVSNGADLAQPILHPDGGKALPPEHYYQRWFALYLSSRCPGCIRYPTGCCLMLSPAMAVPPLLDEDFFFYGEDVDLGWRVLRTGRLLATVAAARVRHAGSAGSRNGSLFYEYHMNRAHIMLASKLARNGFERVTMFAGRAVTLPARALVRSLRRRSSIPLRALLLVWTSRTIRPNGTAVSRR